MQIDLVYLRRHYSSLSDDALREVDETELVDAARKIYDEELAQRKLAPVQKPVERKARSASPAPPDDEVEDDPTEEPNEDPDEGDEPDWLADGVLAASFSAGLGDDNAPYAEARDALDAAGIPCHVLIVKAEPARRTQREFRLMVPASRNLEAQSVLDKEVFNREVEAEWKAHFEMLSDEELREVDLPILLGGLMDRIERITNAYKEELAQRPFE